MPENFPLGGGEEAGKHPQDRGLAGTRRTKERENRVWLDQQVDWRDDLNLSPYRLLVFLFDLPRFDNRLELRL